ncbi:hypothetical protein C8Q74DRAFT_1233227 [Fomes fomentarius]|nr:hypothetical protein C8Q74DRAFT_1233227 [Fomes fomentarius]
MCIILRAVLLSCSYVSTIVSKIVAESGFMCYVTEEVTQSYPMPSSITALLTCRMSGSTLYHDQIQSAFGC